MGEGKENGQERGRMPATVGGTESNVSVGRKRGLPVWMIRIVAKDLIVPNITTTQRILVQAPVFLSVRTLLLSLRSQRSGRQRTA